MIINILKECLQIFSEFDLIKDVSSNETNEKPVALFHELYVFRSSRIRFLSTIVNKVYSEIVHVEISKKSLIFFVFCDWEIHEHNEFLLFLREKRQLCSSLSCSKRKL